MRQNELSELYYLNRETEAIIKRISDLKYKVNNVKRYIKNSEEISSINRELSYLTSLLYAHQKKCLIQQKKIEEYICKVEDSQMRMILAYRYINGLSWQQVAFAIGEYDESYPRKKHNKFLSMQEKVKLAENSEN